MSHFSYKCCHGLSAIAFALAVSASASAADLDESYKDDAAGASDRSIEAIKVGGFIGVRPSYEGSDEYEAFGLPYIFPVIGNGPSFFNRFDVYGLDDIRFKLIDRNGFLAGPLAGYDMGRDEDDGDLLEGLGDIDGGFVGGGFIGYNFGPILFDVSYHHFFGDADGYQIRFGAESVRYVSDRTKLTARIGATYADEGYMDSYFSVSGAGPADLFEADAGFKDVNAQIGVQTQLDQNWSVRGSAKYSRLLGDAADSTIVENENQFFGLLGLSYKFNMAD